MELGDEGTESPAHLNVYCRTAGSPCPPRDAIYATVDGLIHLAEADATEGRRVETTDGEIWPEVLYATVEGLVHLAEADATEGEEETAVDEDWWVDEILPEVAAAEALGDWAATLALNQTIREIMGGDSGFGSSPWLDDNQDDAFMGD